MATATPKKLKLDDELELAFLDSDPRKPRSLSRERREVAKEVRLKVKDNDFKLLCRIINRHATGLWATAAIVEFLLIWLRIGR